MIIDYGPKPFEKCTRKQLLELCYALEEMRDRAIVKGVKLEDEITDRANVEADLRAQLAEAKAKLTEVQTHLDNMH